MPYIGQGQRLAIDVDGARPETAGELNYAITKLAHQYILRKGRTYMVLNEVIGALECAKLELYRMVAAPYEDNKRGENGGVSVLDSEFGR